LAEHDWGRAQHILPLCVTESGRRLFELPDLLAPGDCLVVNDSKVIAARLTGKRIGRGTTEPAIEATLHRRLDGSKFFAGDLSGSGIGNPRASCIPRRIYKNSIAWIFHAQFSKNCPIAWC